jgi:hypothetical protein
LQHDGHSRTIVGIEIHSSASKQQQQLLLFDPSCKKNQFERKIKDNKIMSLVRNSLTSFKSKNKFQLLLIKGLLDDNEREVKLFIYLGRYLEHLTVQYCLL